MNTKYLFTFLAFAMILIVVMVPFTVDGEAGFQQMDLYAKDKPEWDDLASKLVSWNHNNYLLFNFIKENKEFKILTLILQSLFGNYHYLFLFSVFCWLHILCINLRNFRCEMIHRRCLPNKWFVLVKQTAQMKEKKIQQHHIKIFIFKWNFVIWIELW